MASPFPQTSSITRSEYEQLRGPLDQAGSNGNGHSPGPEIELVPARTCRGCPTSISGHPSKQWCSEECRRAHRNSAGTRRQATAVTPAAVTPGSFTALIGALERAGAEVAVLSVRFADQSWTLTRTTNGRT